MSNIRPLTDAEGSNLGRINESGVETALVFLTETGLHKSILDAVRPLRELLKKCEIHDYNAQEKGPIAKRMISVEYFQGSEACTFETSLYRPKTKDGDPRIWIYGIRQCARPDDVLAFFELGGKRLGVVNLSQSNLDDNRSAPAKLVRFLGERRLKSEGVSGELLDNLRSISQRGPIRAVCSGSTAVGRSIETALGISINSSRDPDFKGIEIKSGRSQLAGKETRVTLFACVPDWSISACKSSHQILERFGYWRGNDFKLYCTVSTQRANSQSLQLELVENHELLKEFATVPIRSDVAVWPMSLLFKRLREKHGETFWIKADSEFHLGVEYFHLKSAFHTKNPSTIQFERMVADGSITVDHLIKRKSPTASNEKGPLFKTERKNIRELFMGAPVEYSLV